jgi:hypothetical protein
MPGFQMKISTRLQCFLSGLLTSLTVSTEDVYGQCEETLTRLESALNMTWEESIAKWLNENGGIIKKPSMTLLLEYTE